jgi:hypothetical protein
MLNKNTDYSGLVCHWGRKSCDRNIRQTYVLQFSCKRRTHFPMNLPAAFQVCGQNPDNGVYVRSSNFRTINQAGTEPDSSLLHSCFTITSTSPGPKVRNKCVYHKSLLSPQSSCSMSSNEDTTGGICPVSLGAAAEGKVKFRPRGQPHRGKTAQNKS